MTTEERTRYEVLFEDMTTNLRVLAECQTGLVAQMNEMKVNFRQDFQQLDHRLMKLEVGFIDLNKKVDRLDEKVDQLSADTQERLVSIETHLGLGPPRPRLPTRRAVAKKRKAS